MPAPFVVPPDGGRATWTDGLNLFMATGTSTGGALAFWESRLPAGSSPPLHVHTREDEAFYVLDGELTFRVGDEQVVVGPGAFLWGPRGVPHQYRVDSPIARLLTIFVPGGGEELFFEMSRPAGALTMPPPSDDRPFAPEELEEMAERYGARVLGPPMSPG